MPEIMNKAYWGRYKYIGDDTSNKTNGVKVEVEVRNSLKTCCT